MHHGTCVTHVPWCMSGSLTRGGGENVPGIPGACAPAILRIWQEAHYTGAKLLSEPVPVYCQLDHWEQTSVKCESKYNDLHSRNVFENVVYKKAIHFVLPCRNTCKSVIHWPSRMRWIQRIYIVLKKKKKNTCTSLVSWNDQDCLQRVSNQIPKFRIQLNMFTLHIMYPDKWYMSLKTQWCLRKSNFRTFTNKYSMSCSQARDLMTTTPPLVLKFNENTQII